MVSLGVQAGRYYIEYSLQSRRVKSVSEHLGFSAFYLDCSLGSLKVTYSFKRQLCQKDWQLSQTLNIFPKSTPLSLFLLLTKAFSFYR